jgi:hypothetical protein
VNHLCIVKKGLAGKEKIITQGFQRVREGMTVAPEPVKAQPEKSDNAVESPESAQ